MNSKERVIKALKHEEPDQVPIFATLTPQVAEKLSQKLGTPADLKDAFLSDRVSHTEILLELGNDAIGISPGRSKGSPTVDLGNGQRRDEWGLVYKKIGPYYEPVERPLAGVESVKDISNYNFPSADSPGRFDVARHMTFKYGDRYALVGCIECTMFELAWSLVGFEKFLMDLTRRADYTLELLDIVKDYNLECGKKLIKLGADIIWTGDDFGTQEGMLISPNLWRDIFKPRFEEVFQTLKKTNSEIIIAYHSCGSIRPIIEDLIEIGLEVLNPIQPKARNMDLTKLKELYGDRLAFFGGVDIQNVLPNGTPQQVEEEVKSRIRAAGQGGGYLLAPAHNIQPDTTIENIFTLFQSVKEHGSYPLVL